MLEQFVHAFPGSLGPILLTMVYSAVCKPFDVEYRRRSRFAHWRRSTRFGGRCGVRNVAWHEHYYAAHNGQLPNFGSLCGAGCVEHRRVRVSGCIFCAEDAKAYSPRAIDGINIPFGLSLAFLYFRAFPDVILNVTNFRRNRRIDLYLRYAAACARFFCAGHCGQHCDCRDFLLDEEQHFAAHFAVAAVALICVHWRSAPH